MQLCKTRHATGHLPHLLNGANRFGLLRAIAKNVQFTRAGQVIGFQGPDRPREMLGPVVGKYGDRSRAHTAPSRPARPTSHAQRWSAGAVDPWLPVVMPHPSVDTRVPASEP